MNSAMSGIYKQRPFRAPTGIEAFYPKGGSDCANGVRLAVPWHSDTEPFR